MYILIIVVIKYTHRVLIEFLGEDRYGLPIKPTIPLHVGAFWREEGGQNGLHGHVGPRNSRRLSVDRLSAGREAERVTVTEKAEKQNARNRNRTRRAEKELSDEPSALELCNL